MSEDKPCILSDHCPYLTAVCKVSEPDEGCYVYRYFKKLIDKDSYDEGMEDAWETVKKICLYPDINTGGLIDIFGQWQINLILSEYSAKEAKEKIDNYIKEKSEFRVGDELVEIGTNNKYIFICNYDDLVRVIDKSGTSWLTYQSKFKKTGRHFDEVETLFKKLREDNNESNKE